MGYITEPYFDKISALVSPNMLTLASVLPPVSFQEAVINIRLNSTMFLTFLMGLCSSTSTFINIIKQFLGIYTTVYFGTVYLYGKCVYNYELQFFLMIQLS